MIPPNSRYWNDLKEFQRMSGNTMTKDDWELAGVGPLGTAGAVWRCRMGNGGWLYAMWNVEAKTWSLTFVPL